MKGIVEYFRTKRPDLTLIPEQEELLKDLVNVEIQKVAESCGRGFSKTLCSALVALWFADEYSTEIGRPLEILLISHQQKIYDRIDEFFLKDKSLRPRLRVKGINYEIPREKFQFTDNLSIVTTCLATSKKVRGNRCDILIIDEAQDVPEHIYKVALGCLTGDICKVIIIGTPRPSETSKSSRNWFIEIVDCPDKYGYKLKQWSSSVCWWNAKALIEWKQIYNEEEWASEVDGVPSTKEQRMMFPRKHIDASIFDTECIREGGVGSTIEAGIDWGGVECKTCLTVIERLSPSKYKVLWSSGWKGAIEAYIDELVKILQNFKVDLIKADSRPPEFKGWLEKYGYKPFYIDGVYNKEQELSQLQKRIREHSLIIPECLVPLIKQLCVYKKGMRTGDFVDSLALAVYQPVTPLKKPREVIIIV